MSLLGWRPHFLPPRLPQGADPLAQRHLTQPVPSPPPPPHTSLPRTSQVRGLCLKLDSRPTRALATSISLPETSSWLLAPLPASASPVSGRQDHWAQPAVHPFQRPCCSPAHRQGRTPRAAGSAGCPSPRPLQLPLSPLPRRAPASCCRPSAFTPGPPSQGAPDHSVLSCKPGPHAPAGLPTVPGPSDFVVICKGTRGCHVTPDARPPHSHGATSKAHPARTPATSLQHLLLWPFLSSVFIEAISPPNVGLNSHPEIKSRPLLPLSQPGAPPEPLSTYGFPFLSSLLLENYF